MSAKNATLRRTGPHSVEDGGSGRADGISNEQVFLYFSATWRSKPVLVTMCADRYSASFGDSHSEERTERLTDWRTYATEARYGEDPNERGGSVTGTARSALSKLCEPMVAEWLGSDAYTASFQTAVARLVMRKFEDRYSASNRVTEALVIFRRRLDPAVFKAILATLHAYDAYADAKSRAFNLINGE